MRSIDSFPTNTIKHLQYRVGRVFPFGATLTDGGVNFSIFSKEATGCTLLLYHRGMKKPFVEIPFPESFRIGDVYTMMVFGLDSTIRSRAFGLLRKRSCWIPMPRQYPAVMSGVLNRIRKIPSNTAVRSLWKITTGKVTNRWN